MIETILFCLKWLYYEVSDHEFSRYAPVAPIHIVDGDTVQLGTEETLHAFVTDIYEDGALIALYHCACHHLGL